MTIVLYKIRELISLQHISSIKIQYLLWLHFAFENFGK